MAITEAMISIHAPARGATRIQRRADGGRGISIHAPARGATPLSWGGVQEMSISIHAPARGATVRCRFPTTATAYFNPRPREGGDRVLNSSYDPSYSFQSTPPRGGRRHLGQAAGTVKYFNPRPREGGDDRGRDGGLRADNFNPRPREGGDIAVEIQVKIGRASCRERV